MTELKNIADQLVNLTVKEVQELVNILKDDYGLEAVVAQTVVQQGNAGGANDSAQAEEKTKFDVILKSAGTAKLSVVKLVKEFTSLGLKEAKELVDAAPKPIKSDISKEEAETIKKVLEEAGAEVEVK